VAVVLVPSFRLSAGRVVGRDEPAVPSLIGSLRSAAILIAGVLVLGQIGSAEIDAYAVRGLVIATIALSLVAVTGLSGQVSLAQYLFVGIGAFMAGDLFGGDSALGMLVGGLVAALLGIVVALPSARLRGLHLALSTFGMALVGRELVLGAPGVFGLGGLAVGRPEVLGFSTESDAAFAVWCAIVFSVLAVLVGGVRRSWFGRQLTAVRDSELASATLGLPVRSTKVVVFALSGFIAGCSGALFGGLAGAVQGTQFDPVNSLVILLFAYVGGITSVAGALIAGTLYALLTYAEATFPDLAGLVFIAVAATAVGLGRQPNGLAGILLDARQRIGTLRPARPGATPASVAPASSPIPVGEPA
jgi:branched-chain amino acid transport system permease protein